MDERNASKLLDETFNNDFEIDRFSRFVKELFNKFHINQRSWGVWKEYQDYIDSYQQLGSYRDSSKGVIDVLVVKLKKTSSRDRARTMQRNFVAKYIGNKDKDAALVAFYGDDPQDWRFSFVKMEYRLAEVDGAVKVVKELTPAKRYSFLVGTNEPNHTCKRQLLKLIMEEKVNPSLEEIEEAFSIDNVTKKFFLEYKNLFLALKESLEKIIEKDSYVKKEIEDKGISTVDFAKKLLGQIVFIYFLQKKGWLGVEKDKESGGFRPWGSGPKDFLRRMFDKEIVQYDNFFNDILEPLFYEALATKRDDDYYSRFNCKIPFLNGGLFEPINDYAWTGTEILLDDSVFGKILDTFDRFNFTVKEDEPLEKEVAVDPEMLGKVFENLLDVKDRKSRGAFYTPREIVHYMCQQSLINYLETNTDVPIGDIEKFIQLGDFALDLMIKEQEQIKKYGRSYDIDEKYVLPKSIKENYLKIDRLLKDIKIVDPAVGSGAFPIGMMNEIVKARSVLTVFFNESEQENRTNYNFKRETIENSLYGVDIDSSAVDIAKLRFWLSLIVDESDIMDIQPLPNLDHKIMCGNSLLEEFEGVKLFDEELLGEIPKDNSFELEPIDREEQKLNQELHEIYTGKKENKGRSKEIKRELEKLKRKRKAIVAGHKEEVPQLTLDKAFQNRRIESHGKLKELKRLQKLFFNEQSRELKRRYRSEIDQIEWGFIEETLREEGNEEAIGRLKQYKKNKSKPFFLWKLYFAEIFQEKRGFDVVIGNPPYLGFQGIDKNLKRALNQKFISANGKFDLYIPFIELGFLILKDNGFFIFICQTAFTKRAHGTKIREFLSKNTCVKELMDFEHDQMFEGATNYTGIFSFVKGYEPNNKIKFSTGFSDSFIEIDQSKLSYEPWVFLDKRSEEIVKKITNNQKLKDMANISEGVVTGINKLYLKNKTELKSNKFEPTFFFKCYRGREIEKYHLKKNSEYLFYPYERKGNTTSLITESVLQEKMENYMNYLKSNIHLIKKRKYFTESNKKWYELWNQRKIENFLSQKIITPELSEKNRFMIVDSDTFYGDTVCGITLDTQYKTKIKLEFLLTILNSQLMEWFYKKTTVPKAGGFFIYKVMFLKNIPIKNISPSEQKPFVKLADQILSITKDDDYPENPEKQARVKELEKEIDKLVYKLYDLTPEEIDIVENFNKEK